MGFIVCGMPHDEARMQKDFTMIEEHCEGDGWYEKTFPLAGIDGPQRVELGAHPHVDAGQADQMRQSVGVPGAQADRGIRKVRRGFPLRREKPPGKSARLISRPPFR